MLRRLARLALVLPFVGVALAADPPAKPTAVAGPTATGFLLPNGWHLTPAGKHTVTTDLPLNIVPLKDNRHAVVSTCGFNKHHVSVVDLVDNKVVGTATVGQSWYGLAVTPDEGTVYVSGGGSSSSPRHTFTLKDGAPTRVGEPEKIEPRKGAKDADPDAKLSKTFASGMHLDPKAGTLYALDIDAGILAAVDPKTGETTKAGDLGGRPYDVKLARNGLLYVSDWAGRRVLAVDPGDLRVVAKIPVGEHPNQIAVHPTDDRIFVACASADAVSVIDTRRGTVTETIGTGLFPRAPEGSTPDAVAVSPDGATLAVANADNNCVTLIDIAAPNKSAIKGFVPTGWYPTAVAFTPDGKHLVIGVGKGLQSKANPIKNDKPKDDDDAGPRGRLFPYIGTTLEGAVSVVPVPDEAKLKEYTAQVYRNCPYSDAQLTTAPHPVKTAIPTKVGETGPIQHVIYIIKENRTYDQVFGDMAEGPNKKGNGDPSLCMFPRKVSPNHHKLADEFVLLDNLYCNGQVSRDGHPWSTAAYHTDYTGRDWHLTYSGRKGVKDTDDGDLARPPSGYLWDACKRAGLTYRNYGEYGRRVSQPDGTITVEAAVPGLVGHMCPDYGVPKAKGGRRPRDTENADTFLKEYAAFEAAGTLPRMTIISLGEDHTTGTTPGTFTPQACVASNDLALGRIVEAVSKSKSWSKTAIFVIEDDAQNGPDHVDAHRTVGLVISPYTKRKHVDSTQYATVSMIRTMELILGLPPLSQYDAAARPMFESFTDTPDTTAYTHAPAGIDLDAKNGAKAFGAARSARMDFSEYDRIDDFELNDILWHAIKGENAPMPPAVRRAVAFRSQAGK